MVEAIFTVGLAASGKSTWANKQNALVLDSDKIRGEIYGDETCQDNPDKVFNLMYRRGIAALQQGQSVVFCSTNLVMRYRIHTLKQIKRLFPNVHCRAVVFNTPLSICKEWNKKRERQVPDWLFERQMKSFQMPVYNEGWDEIEIITPAEYDKKEFAEGIWDDVRAIGSQDNPHHSLTLYNHLGACVDNIDICSLNEKDGFDMLIAAAMHDIGKAYTRSYDENGVAHYYSHQNYGAFVSMNMGASVESIQLINYHMCPYDSKSAPTWEKRLGEDLWKKILILHDADERSHQYEILQP